MKNIFKFLMVAAALTVAACDEKPVVPEEPEKPENPTNPETPTKPEVQLNDSLTFTLELGTIEAEQAQIKIKHNGTTKDTWYGFVTTDLTSKDGALINSEVERLSSEAEKISGLKKNTSTTVTLRSLTPETEYKYIAFGLTEDGEIYGNFASITFKTAKGELVITETDDWTIEYQRGEIEGVTAELFTIQFEEGKGCYFTTIDTYTLETNELTTEDYVKYVIEYEVPAMLEYGYAWEDLYISESYTIASERMVNGDYIAIAIGYDAKAEATGAYTAQEFTVVEETAKADYTQWLGDYDITCAYQYENEKGERVDGEATYTVTLAHYDNNNMYAMLGWETNGDIENDVRDYVGEFAVPVYYNDGKLSFREITLTDLETDDGSQYLFGFYGFGNMTYGGKTYESTLIAWDDMEMAVAETTDGGKTGIINGTEVSESGYEIDYLGMFYCALPASGKGDLAYWNAPMEFPLTMTKVESEEAPATKALSTPSFKASDLKAKTMNKMNKMQKKEFTPMYLK